MKRWLRLLATSMWGSRIKPGPDVDVRRWRYTTDLHGHVEVKYWTRLGRPTTFSRSVRRIIEQRMERVLTRPGSSLTVTYGDGESRSSTQDQTRI